MTSRSDTAIIAVFAPAACGCTEQSTPASDAVIADAAVLAPLVGGARSNLRFFTTRE